MQLVLQFILKMLSGIWGKSTVYLYEVLPFPTMANHVSMEIVLCTGHCHAGKVWASIVALKLNCNAKAFKDVLYNCLLPTFWQQFKKEPHMGVLVKCPQTFGRTLYIIL